MLLALTGCATYVPSISYVPENPGSSDLSELGPIEIGQFVDRRNKPANSLGGVRNGWGMVVKKIETNEPVSNVVRTAVLEAVASRGAMLSWFKWLDCS